jgi:iron(III) transport system ATP-binding protein
MRVLQVNLLGRSSHVHLCAIGAPPGDAASLLARVHGVFVPEKGSTVQIRIDATHVFVFAAE